MRKNLSVVFCALGIAASRLTFSGSGPFAPVASSDFEHGKPGNRRVEPVKQ